VPTPSTFRVPSRLLALAFAFLTATACSGPASTTSSAAAVGHGTQATPGERRAVLAFSGSYIVKSVVTATTGTYSESVGAVHFYTWQAVPDCSSQSCVVKVTSSTGSHTTFAYSNGKFLGTGSGSATCYDPGTGSPTGSDPTTLHDTLVPATTSSPVTALTGVVHLTTSGACGLGTGTFGYTLSRTGSTSPVTV
jgi:hypothetical protein